MSKKSNQSDKSSPQPDNPGENTGSAAKGKDYQLLQSLPMAIVAFDGDLRIIDSNARANEMLYPDDYIDKSLAKGTDDKTRLGWNEPLKKVLSSGEARTFDEVAYSFKGKTRLLRITCTALPSRDAGDSVGGTIVIEDITQRAGLQRQLAEAERLAALGRLAAKVAHELNNPMDGILRYVNLAIRAVEQEKLEKPQEYLSHCREGLMRMVKITSELLEFSRRSRTSLEYVKIEQIIEDAIKAMEPRAMALNVRIMHDYGGGIPEIRSGNLFQVFSNLVKNALDAMPNGGELKVSSRLEGENALAIEFCDTGTGFPPEDAEALFEPFFTASASGKGTGLGLAICRDILENRNGRITARNAPQGGCIFKVSLPLEGNSKEDA
jgi:signal transduction histidine kinase